jgi:hypothetical protein
MIFTRHYAFAATILLGVFCALATPSAVEGPATADCARRKACCLDWQRAGCSQRSPAAPTS